MNKEKQSLHLPEGTMVKVWDVLVRLSHWAMVFFFAVIYLRYRKFPLHAYAGYLMLLVVSVRILWGVFGSRAARFSEFWFSPTEVWRYAKDMIKGRPGHYTSHNPMGAMMVYALLGMMLVNGCLGIMLYSAGQELGPLGNRVPAEWEDTLIGFHKTLGHMAATLVALHMAGVVWASHAHRENYVTAMFTGFKRLPKEAEPVVGDAYAAVPEQKVVRPAFLSIERWFNYRHPVLGSLLLLGAVSLVVLELTRVVTLINKYLISY